MLAIMLNIYPVFKTCISAGFVFSMARFVRKFSIKKTHKTYTGMHGRSPSSSYDIQKSKPKAPTESLHNITYSSR